MSKNMPISTKRGGFTLIELLVSMSVISILIAFTLPAVQSSREAARKMTCGSHLKQLGLALHNYHDAHRTLPPGTVTRFSSVRQAFETLFTQGGVFDPGESTQETPWVLQLYPYLDQASAWHEFDANLGSFGHVDLQPPYQLSGVNTNSLILKHSVEVLQCPSDRQSAFLYDVNKLVNHDLGAPILPATRANYAANWGNTTWQQDADLDGDGRPDPGRKFQAAPFARGRSVRLAEVTDGLDSTVFLSEVLKGVRVDGRGAFLTPMPGGSLYMCRLAPNGTRDLLGVFPDGQGDQMPFPATCDAESGIPCRYNPARFATYAGARSHHAGGVQVLMGSGAVRFASDSIDTSVWRALHSISRNDAIGDY